MTNGVLPRVLAPMMAAVFTAVCANVCASEPATSEPATQPSNQPLSAAIAAFHPPGMTKITTGALKIVAVQGTRGAAALGHDPVTVQLFGAGNILRTYTGVLGDGGILEIHNLPLDTPFQPVVTITHAGVEQETVGPPMHKYQPAIELDMKVYESTAEKPAWTCGLRKITVEPVVIKGELRLQVTEVVGGFNPTDRAWAGQNGVTLTIPLPRDAQNVQLGQGLAESNPKIISGSVPTITRGRAMQPGSTAYEFGYQLPVKNGAAEISFAVPAMTGLFAVYVPQSFKVDQAVGVKVSAASGKSGVVGRTLLVGKGVKETVTVGLSNITPPVVVPVADAPVIDGKTTLDLKRPGEK